MSDTILSVSRVSVGYGDSGLAAADVSFTLRKGEILCLVGESGCGKTTVLRAVIADPAIRLAQGEITLGDTALSRLPAGARHRLCCREMGMVFQTPEATFNPIRTYRKQFVETLKSHGKYDPKAFDDRVAAAFAKVELADWRRVLGECPFALSGGMNQRVALALAMLLEQRILLCDEPTSALDATIQLQVARELKRLRDVSGVTQIIVTHNLALARFLADRIGVMYAGRLVELGPTAGVLRDPCHPYTRSLIAAIPGLDGDMPVGLPGSPPMSGPFDVGCEFQERCPVATADCGQKKYDLRMVGDGHHASCCGGREAAI